MIQHPRGFKNRAGKESLVKHLTKKRDSTLPNLDMASPVEGSLTSPIVTLVVGREQRLFAAHQDVLSASPYLRNACRTASFDSANTRRVVLSDEEPEAFSCILEYLYKGDYSPRLLHDKKHDAWYLERIEDGHPYQNPNEVEARGQRPTISVAGLDGLILRETVVYSYAEKYGLEELKRLALRKQGLQSGIEVATVLRSARFAYDNTPDSESRLRAHYLALIIQCRETFKRSGTMQMEMEIGGKLFFDLFVAMCNHLDDLMDATDGQP
ncbi:hypothetical protein L228DRAFT_38994 [Xylona heveae TC161]|uniref:BTB domain-containing protein n=1 Tax=Xylona heveae (strain CBS 132557 / TC161) TaxID=1328760 RepID=A0A164ZYF9_XYLHT|nr:hypothetical protein L228DRAFT_38994 [Xylona heveae TC161]KZF19700.1 hypothetical protein L228DRAFT_38994 [Xylona heveae TC161]